MHNILLAGALATTLLGSSCNPNSQNHENEIGSKNIEHLDTHHQTRKQEGKTIKFEEANTDKTQGENIASTES